MTTTRNQSRSSAPKPLTGTPTDTGAKPPAKQAKPTAGNVRKARPKAAHNPITSLPKTPSRNPKKPSPRGASFPGITPEAIRRRKEEDELKLRAAGLTGPPAQLKPPTPPNGPPPPGDAEALQPISLHGKLAGSENPKTNKNSNEFAEWYDTEYDIEDDAAAEDAKKILISHEIEGNLSWRLLVPNLHPAARATGPVSATGTAFQGDEEEARRRLVRVHSTNKIENWRAQYTRRPEPEPPPWQFTQRPTSTQPHLPTGHPPLPTSELLPGKPGLGRRAPL